MQMINYISQTMLPMVFALVIFCGFRAKTDIFSAFTEGAADGLKTVISVFPSLAGLMCAVAVFRASGAMDALTGLLSPLSHFTGFPSELISLGTVKMFSSSAATGVLTDIFKTSGPDSFTGTAASIMMCCTETVFYTLSVYSSAAGIKKTGYTVLCAIAANAAGIAASFLIALYMFR